MKKFFTVFCAILMSVMTLMAQDLVFEGVAYNFLNEEELEVVALPGGEKYTGVVKIPYSVVIGEEGPVVGVTSRAYEDESEVMTYRVTKVGDHAFKYCTEMTKLQMPYSLEVIGVEAVSGCTSLEAITMPTNLVRIGDRAFEGSQIGSLTVSGGLKEIGDRVFYNTIATDIMLDHSELTAFGKETFTGSTVQRILLPSKLRGHFINFEGHWGRSFEVIFSLL